MNSEISGIPRGVPYINMSYARKGENLPISSIGINLFNAANSAQSKTFQGAGFLVWMWQDAKAAGRSPWPWLLLTLATDRADKLLALFDLNILLDVIQKRQDFYDFSARLLAYAKNRDFEDAVQMMAALQIHSDY